MKPIRTTIDVGGVLATGRQVAVRERLSLPDFGDFRFPEPIAVALEIRRLARGLEVIGTLEGQVAGACARCLDEVKLPMHVEVEEQLEATGDPGPLGENNVWQQDELDLGDLVRQSIDTALPIVLLCHEACGGLCPNCGNKRDGDCRCAISEN